MEFWLILGAIWHVIGMAVSFFMAVIGIMSGISEEDGLLFSIGLMSLFVFSVLFAGAIAGWGAL